MKSVKLAVFMLVAMVFSVSAMATQDKDTLVVERISTASVAATITSHVYTLRLENAAACTTREQALNGAQSTITLAGKPIATVTLARCEAVDYHVQY